MPALAVTVPYALSDEEAVRRLQERYDAVKAAYSEHLEGLEERWGRGELYCRFNSLGMSFAGSVTVAAGVVNIQLELPPLAVVFKGHIERRIREELAAILA